MDEMEMRTLGEAARVTEKLADFVGSIILQLMQKQDYVEERGVKALLTHVRNGRGTLTTSVSEQRAESFKELLKEAHIPYVEIEHQNPDTKERTMFFVYRDSDQGKMKDVLKQFALMLDKSCHEVDLETFENMTEGQPYGTVYGLSKEEVYAFREAAKNHDIHFCVVADGEKYAVIANDAEKLPDVVADMAYFLSGERGHEYQSQLEHYIRMREEFNSRIQPEKGTVKYIVDAKNPRNFISIDGQGFTTHSVGSREETKPDGTVRKILYDAKHVTYPGMDREKIMGLALELGRPVILSQEAFSLVQGISHSKEAILAEDFVEQFERFVKEMKRAKPDLERMPKWEPLYRRENLLGFCDLPIDVVAKIRDAHIPAIYCNGADIAFPKEAEPEVNALLEEYLYHGMSGEQRKEAMEQYRNPTENSAIDFMLTIEPLEMAALHTAYRLPEELMNGTQREAVQRMEQKEIRQQTMNREVAKLLRDQMIDKRMSQEVER